MTVSVVIPSYNSARTIRECLRAVLDQTQPAEEVIVVDSSDDETPQIIRREFPQVCLLDQPRRTYCGTARNIGIREAKSELIAVTDADCVVPQDWIAVLLACHRQYEVVCVSGGVTGPKDEHWLAAMDRIFGFSAFLAAGNMGLALTGVGCNFMVRREAYTSVGGCDGLPRGADIVFFRKLARRYGPLLVVPPAAVAHISPSSVEGFTARQFRSGQGFAYARGRDPSLSNSFAVRHPALAAVAALGKAVAIVWRLMMRDQRLLTVVIAHLPTFATGLWYWYRGLVDGSKEMRAQQRGKHQ